MYTAIAQMWNINIEASWLLLKTTSTEKRSYQYNRFTTLLLPILGLSILKYPIVSSLPYACLLNLFSDIITLQVRAVRIPHAGATAQVYIDTSHC